MPAFFRAFLFSAVLLGVGWIVGSAYPAPAQWVAPLRANAERAAANIDLSPQGLARLRSSLSREQYARLTQDAAHLAASSGTVLVVEHESTSAAEHVEAGVEAPPTPSASNTWANSLSLCPMTVTNPPSADGHGVVRNFAALIRVNGVTLVTNPTHGTCLSSGFGTRGGRLHKGVDYYATDGGPIFAAADGVIIEHKYRDDYGNMLLIDHGGGVYTRYAHLSSFADNTPVGARVTAGEQIGLMGNTASYRIPVHLHFEVLLGNYSNPYASFGLMPHSPFTYPAATTPAASAAPSQIAQSDAAAGIIAASAPAPLVAASDNASSHCPGAPITEPVVVTTRLGDTLSSISRQCYGRDDAWPRIAHCNAFLDQRNRGGVSPLNGGDLLYIGDHLTLPGPDGICPS